MGRLRHRVIARLVKSDGWIVEMPKVNLMYKASPLAVALALGLAAAAFPATPARAADLGGDCCSDLEERVATLELTTAKTGNRKVSMKISGWVNAGAIWWTDGFGPKDQRDPSMFDANSNVYVVNNSTSQTRLNISGDGKIRDGLTAGYSMSIRPWGDKLGDVSQIEHNPNRSNIDIRDTYVFLDSKSLGKVQLGLQDSAADGAWYQDLGGSSTWISNMNPGAWNSSFYLRDENGNLADVTWGDLLQEMSDGQVPRVSYYTAEVGGLQFAGSAGGDDTYGAALYFARTLGTVSIKAGVGYDLSRRSDAVDSQSVGTGLTDAANARLFKLAMSGSLYESRSGLYGTLGWSQTKSAVAGRDNATNWYGKAGWRRNVTSLGETNLYGEYDRSANVLANDTEAHVWGVGLVQDVDSIGSSLYLGYRRSELDSALSGGTLVLTPGQSFADPAGIVPKQHFDAVLAGMVLQF